MIGRSRSYALSSYTMGPWRAAGAGQALAHDAEVGAGRFTQFLGVVWAVARAGVSAFHELAGYALIFVGGSGVLQEPGDLGKQGIHGTGATV